MTNDKTILINSAENRAYTRKVLHAIVPPEYSYPCIFGYKSETVRTRVIDEYMKDANVYIIKRPPCWGFFGIVCYFEKKKLLKSYKQFRSNIKGNAYLCALDQNKKAMDAIRRGEKTFAVDKYKHIEYKYDQKIAYDKKIYEEREKMYSQNPVQPSYQYDSNMHMMQKNTTSKPGITTIGLNSRTTIAEPTA